MWRSRAPIFVASLWWGSLGVIGAMVVPTLFAQLPTTAMAGGLAAKLFSMQSWLGVACGLLLLLLSRQQSGAASGSGSATAARGWVVGGTLLAMLLELAIAPHIVARDNLPLWHGLGTASYGLQWVCASMALWHHAGSTAQG